MGKSLMWIYVFASITKKWSKMVKLIDSKIQVNQYMPRFDDDVVLMMTMLEVKKIAKGSSSGLRCPWFDYDTVDQIILLDQVKDICLKSTL